MQVNYLKESNGQYATISQEGSTVSITKELLPTFPLYTTYKMQISTFSLDKRSWNNATLQ